MRMSILLIRLCGHNGPSDTHMARMSVFCMLIRNVGIVCLTVGDRLRTQQGFQFYKIGRPWGLNPRPCDPEAFGAGRGTAPAHMRIGDVDPGGLFVNSLAHCHNVNDCGTAILRILKETTDQYGQYLSVDSKRRETVRDFPNYWDVPLATS